MSKIKRFEDLEVWQEARELCKIVNSLTKKTSFCKDFELVRQIEKSSGSVMDNIAEGYERDGNKEFGQFLSFSKGSCGEVRSQSYRALDKKHITQEEFKDLYNKALLVSKMLSGFMSYLRKSDIKGSKFKI